jgi:putative transposase
MIRRRKPPSQSWRTFLNNHAMDLVSADFFVVPTIAFQLLFAFVILDHERWRPMHFAINRELHSGMDGASTFSRPPLG